MISALTGVLIRLISRHGLINGPRVARQMGFATKNIQKAFKHPSLNKFPIPDGRKLRYANFDRKGPSKADALKSYEEFLRKIREGKPIERLPF